jgi:hypothetical protein
MTFPRRRAGLGHLSSPPASDVVGDSNGPTEFGYNEVTEFGHLSSQSVDLVSDDEYHLVMLDSVGDAMCCGYADGSAVLFCDQDGSVHSRTV